MKSICILTTSCPRFPGDTASVFIERLAQGYRQAGHEVRIIVPLDRAEPQQEQRNGIHYHRFRYGIFIPGRLAFGSGIMPNIRRSPLRILQAPMLFVQMLRAVISNRRRIRYVHAQWLFAGLVAAVAHALCGIPFMVTLRGEDLKLLKFGIIRSLTRRAFERACAVTTVSDGLRIEAEALLGGHACRTVYEGIEVPDVTSSMKSQTLARYHMDEATKFLLCIARAIPLKGIHHAVRLIAEKDLEDFNLVVIGSISDATYVTELKSLAQSLNCLERVRLIGEVHPADVAAFIHASSAVVHLSEYEGRPNAVLEGMAGGKIVIASNIGAHREIIRSGENGILIETDSISAASRDLSYTLHDSKRQQEIEHNARASVSNLTWKRCAEEYGRLCGA